MTGGALVPSSPLVSAVEGIGALAQQRLQVTVHVRGRIDTGLLRRAVVETARSVPELAGRFEPGFWRSGWREQDEPPWRIEEVDAANRENAAEVERARFAAPCDHADPLHLTVVHLQDGDRLVAHVSHLLGDGGGTKELMYRLAANYRHLVVGGTAPEPIRRPRHPLWRLLRGVRIRRLPRYLLGFFDQFWGLRPSGGSAVSMRNVGETVARCERLHLPADRVDRLKASWRDEGATVNDLLLTAFAHGLQEMPGGPHHEINLVVTADLRQLLDQPDHVENLSSIHSLRLGTRPLPTATEMVSGVRAITRRWKRTGLGLATAVYSVALAAILPARWLSRMVGKLVVSGPPADVSRIVMTNMGRLDPERLDFGAGPCTAAYILPPLGYAPTLIAGATGCCGAVDLSVAYQEPALARDVVVGLLESVDRELRALE